MKTKTYYFTWLYTIGIMEIECIAVKNWFGLAIACSFGINILIWIKSNLELEEQHHQDNLEARNEY